MKQKYYVVLRGHQPGIYDSRDNCKQQVDRYTGAVYKSFPNKESAEFARQQQSFLSTDGVGQKGQSSSDYLRHVLGEEFDRVVCTDAACPSNPGPVEYRAVRLSDGKELFRVGPLSGGSVNLAEFLGIVEGMIIMMNDELGMMNDTGGASSQKVILYSDSKIAINRVRKGSFSTTVDRNGQNRQLFDRLDEAMKWLVRHTDWETYVELRQRPTKLWGQIPADFGRK